MTTANTKNKKKKKKRKLKLKLPFTSLSSAQSSGDTSAKRKKKKKFKLSRIRKEVWFVLAGVIALILLITIPRAIETNKLKKLGYDKEAIAAIREMKLQKKLLDNQWYSDYLASCIKSKSVNTDYLDLYTVISGDKYLDDTDFLMVGRLRDKGYEEDQILNLYKNLRFVELTPLLVYDYQLIEDSYIEDCKEHPENNRSAFTLSRSYYTPYKNPMPADSSTVEMLINKTYYLDENYVPAEPTDLSNKAGAPGTQLSKEAAEAMEAWAVGGMEKGVAFYTTSSYRSYDGQKTLYDNYVLNHGQEQADRESARPGHSEHQTGLAVDVCATGDESSEFGDTTAFLWASTNCMDYGWILRYPKNKEDITGYEYESWHFRYVGKDLAKAIYASGMTFDEFWCLYLKPWSDEANKPSDAILEATDWHKIGKEEETPAEGEASASPNASASPGASASPNASAKPQ